MSATSTDKKCWNCEESVHPHAIICPYCRADLANPKVSAESKETQATPYRFAAKPVGDQAIPTPLYSPAKESNQPGGSESVKVPPTRTVKKNPAPAASAEEAGLLKETLTPMIGLLAGVVFLLFGLILLIYSSEAVFTLHWKTSYWPLFLIASLPLLWFGWRSLQTLDGK